MSECSSFTAQDLTVPGNPWRGMEEIIQPVLEREAGLSAWVDKV